MIATLDLGKITEPMLIFGGAYSNLQATIALHEVAVSKGIAASHVICTGDVVAYCAQPEETVALIRAWGAHVVQGNCELAIGESLDDCGCGFEEGTTCSILSDSWYRYTQKHVSVSSREWMTQLPKNIRFTMQGRRFLCLHGDAHSNNHFVFSSCSKAEKAKQCEALGADAVIGGHCGLPFGQLIAKPAEATHFAWLNPGVIGMPANDGSTFGWYCILTPCENGIEVAWHRLEYDYQEAQEAMQKAGLPRAYREALATGIWPSDDVLPTTEKQLKGQAIAIEPMLLQG